MKKKTDKKINKKSKLYKVCILHQFVDNCYVIADSKEDAETKVRGGSGIVKREDILEHRTVISAEKIKNKDFKHEHEDIY